MLQRWEARYAKWLRVCLHLVAAGSLAAALISAVLFVAALLGWAGNAKTFEQSLVVLGGTTGVVAAVEFWGTAVFLLLLLRVLVAADRRLDGANGMSDEYPDSQARAVRDEEWPRRPQT